MEKSFTPGEDFYVCELDTEQGIVKIGAMICYDREFPESARILMLKGAEIILVPNAADIDTNRCNQLHARAFENMLGIALTNYATPKNNGHSLAFTGIAYDKDEKALEMKLIEGDGKEQILIADFAIEALRTYRQHECWGNAYRKPKAYRLLTDETVIEPFFRSDAKR